MSLTKNLQKFVEDSDIPEVITYEVTQNIQTNLKLIENFIAEDGYIEQHIKDLEALKSKHLNKEAEYAGMIVDAEIALTALESIKKRYEKVLRGEPEDETNEFVSAELKQIKKSLVLPEFICRWVKIVYSSDNKTINITNLDGSKTYMDLYVASEGFVHTRSEEGSTNISRQISIEDLDLMDDMYSVTWKLAMREQAQNFQPEYQSMTEFFGNVENKVNQIKLLEAFDPAKPSAKKDGETETAMEKEKKKQVGIVKELMSLYKSERALLLKTNPKALETDAVETMQEEKVRYMEAQLENLEIRLILKSKPLSKKFEEYSQAELNTIVEGAQDFSTDIFGKISATKIPKSLHTVKTKAFGSIGIQYYLTLIFIRAQVDVPRTSAEVNDYWNFISHGIKNPQKQDPQALMKILHNRSHEYIKSHMKASRYLVIDWENATASVQEKPAGELIDLNAVYATQNPKIKQRSEKIINVSKSAYEQTNQSEKKEFFNEAIKLGQYQVVRTDSDEYGFEVTGGLSAEAKLTCAKVFQPRTEHEAYLLTNEITGQYYVIEKGSTQVKTFPQIRDQHAFEDETDIARLVGGAYIIDVVIPAHTRKGSDMDYEAIEKTYTAVIFPEDEWHTNSLNVLAESSNITIMQTFSEAYGESLELLINGQFNGSLLPLAPRDGEDLQADNIAANSLQDFFDLDLTQKNINGLHIRVKSDDKLYSFIIDESGNKFKDGKGNEFFDEIDFISTDTGGVWHTTVDEKSYLTKTDGSLLTLSHKGQIIDTFDEVVGYKEGFGVSYFMVKINGKEALIDDKGNTILPEAGNDLLGSIDIHDFAIEGFPPEGQKGSFLVSREAEFNAAIAKYRAKFPKAIPLNNLDDWWDFKHAFAEVKSLEETFDGLAEAKKTEHPDAEYFDTFRASTRSIYIDKIIELQDTESRTQDQQDLLDELMVWASFFKPELMPYSKSSKKSPRDDLFLSIEEERLMKTDIRFPSFVNESNFIPNFPEGEDGLYGVNYIDKGKNPVGLFIKVDLKGQYTLCLLPNNDRSYAKNIKKYPYLHTRFNSIDGLNQFLAQLDESEWNKAKSHLTGDGNIFESEKKLKVKKN